MQGVSERKHAHDAGTVYWHDEVSMAVTSCGWQRIGRVV
jgi:hypothetical protein